MLSGRWLIIGLGGVAMFISMLLQKKQYPQVAVWKMAVLTVWLTITGVLGTMVLAYIEQGSFGGTDPWVLGLSQGHLWSLVSIVIGTVWLVLSTTKKPAAKKKNKRKA